MFVIQETIFEKRHRIRYVNGKKYFLDPTIMYKPGYTDRLDAATRFTKEFLDFKSYINVPTEEDFIVKPVWSAWFTPEKTSAFEKEFERRFPKNIWTTKQYTGCKEYRYIPALQASQFIKNLHKVYPSTKYPPREGHLHVYFTKFTKKPKREDLFED